MSYKMYDKPCEPDGIISKISNSKNFQLMRNKMIAAIIENEKEIDKLTYEITEITACNKSQLKGFSAIQLQMIKEKILGGWHYEIAIKSMRLLRFK